jgi:hypothetical protein
MNTAVLIDRVLVRMEGKIAGPEVEQILPTALTMLAKQVAESKEPSVCQLLKKDFTVTVTGGTGSLTTPLTASEPILLEYLPQALAFTSNGLQLHYLPDRVQLNLERSNLFIWYTVDNSTLRTKNTDGNLSTLATTVTITANYVPLIASVSDLLSDDLVDIVVALLSA